MFDQLRSRVLARLGSPAAQMVRASQLTRQNAAQAAFRLLAKAAKADVPKAWYHVGRAYLSGCGVPASLSTALRWLVRAAEADEVEAQTLLAFLALQGKCGITNGNLFEAASTDLGQPPNYGLAKLWAERAAAHGSAEAQAILGCVLTDGPSELRDRSQGEQYYQDSAAAGCAQGCLGWAQVLLHRSTLEATRAAREQLEKAAAANLFAAQYMLGLIAESGAAGTQDFAAAAAHYHIAAQLGHPSAQLRYGIALLTGRGVEMDPFRAESWLRRAALAGEPMAAAIVGDLYVRPGALPPNYAEASIWLRRAAEAGHAGAAKMLGHLLLEGAGVASDPEEAARWLRVAIAGGETDARNDLARLALAGQVPEADQQTTFRWFEEQAGVGDLIAAFNLGLCLAEGIGVPCDAARAYAWFERAAVAVPAAQYWCGRLRAEGRGCEPDAEAARAWYLRAAETGHADAEVAAGEMLFNGHGGPPDQEMAMALFRRAASTRHPGGLFALKVLDNSKKAGDTPASAILA